MKYVWLLLPVSVLVAYLLWPTEAAREGLERQPVEIEEAGETLEAELAPRLREEAQEAVGEVNGKVQEPASTQPSIEEQELAIRIGTSARVRFAAHDQATGEPLHGIALRDGLTGPWHSQAAESPASAWVRPGKHRFALFRAQYDPVSLDPVTLDVLDDVDLGDHALVRGSGMIDVWVHAVQVAIQEELSIDLVGAGRNPCGLCSPDEERCSHCGYAAKETRRNAKPSVRTTFEGLAGGDYHLTVYDGERLLASEPVVLAPREVRGVEIDLDLVDLTFRVLDAEGQPFNGVWEEEGELFAGPIVFTFLSEEACSGFTSWVPDAQVRRSPLALTEGVEETTDVGKWPAVIATPSPLRAKPLPLERRHPDLFQIRDVPATSRQLLASCGRYFTVVDLELDQADGSPIEVRFDAHCAVPSKGLEGQNVTCASCHGLPAGVFQR